jgi:hypothetical protein
VRAGIKRWTILGAIVAGAMFLSGCRMDGFASPTPTPPSVSSPAGGAASSANGGPSLTDATPSSGRPETTTRTRIPAARPSESAGAREIDCGKVDAPNGGHVGLVAEVTDAGEVGCTEAVNVISDYYRDAPTKSEGTAHHLVVNGWNCMADTGAHTSGQIGCDKDGLGFHTKP